MIAINIRETRSAMSTQEMPPTIVILPPCALWLAGICVPVVTIAQIFLGRMGSVAEWSGWGGEELRAE